MARTFCSGWHPDYANRARSDFPFFALSLGVGKPFASDDRPLPPSFSLARFRKWPFDQGQVGSCFANAAAQSFQIHTMADVADGAQWDTVELSRRLVWYQGRKLDGLLGSRQDGGSVTNALAAMADAPSGVGCCKEETWPYKDEHRWLEAAPPKPVFAEAGVNRLAQIASAEIGDDWKKAIVNGHPITIGIWWPFGWDTEGGTFFDTIGPGGYGHALCVIGWMTKGSALYWQIENSHGPIYAPLSADEAKSVPGYQPAQPDKTHDFWVRDDVLKRVFNHGQAESVTAAGMSGFKTRELVEWSNMMS